MLDPRRHDVGLNIAWPTTNAAMDRQYQRLLSRANDRAMQLCCDSGRLGVMATSFVAPTVAEVVVSRTVPKDAELVGVGVGETGTVPRTVGLSRSVLEGYGFSGKVGQSFLVPSKVRPTAVVVGTGEAELTPTELRDAAAAVVRADGNRSSRLAIHLADGHRDPEAAAQAVTEGALLAAYRYVGQKTDTSIASKLKQLTVVVGGKAAVFAKAEAGAAVGRVAARAQCLARELANTPPNIMTASAIADVAVELGAEYGLGVEVFNRDDLAQLGCGGILGVNAGSVEPPRMVKLTYRPNRPRAHVALVGKGVMYDSGGISIKPSNPMHVLMKMDMSGAAAVLSTMTALGELNCRNQVTAWLMCTDNMPSGSALKLSDVLTIRNGKTVEIHNTDAEGRLILADGLSLAAEEEPDVIADIATLTGAALGALGLDMAAIVGSDDHAIEVAEASAAATDEPVWQLPLAKERYRKLLDSNVADMRNIGGPYAGTITAGIFLSEFTDGRPWVHLDIAGPMNVDADQGWKSKGATGFGTRLLIDFASTYSA